MFSNVKCLFSTIYGDIRLTKWYTICLVFFCHAINGEKFTSKKFLLNTEKNEMSSYRSRLTMSKCLCHKSPKDKAVFQLIRDFIVSTSALGMPPPYIKSSRKSRVVPT